jgi:hypothetical protein
MIRVSNSLQAPLQATTFDPDVFALAESDRFIERIDKKQLSILLENCRSRTTTCSVDATGSRTRRPG